MFIVRADHLAAFEAAARESFEERTCEHLFRAFPEECARLGRAGVLARIRDGVRRAARYGIEAERDARGFIRLQFALRPDFDTSLWTRWARPILERRETPAAERLNELRAEARRRRAPTSQTA